jgi:hypothetical protein
LEIWNPNNWRGTKHLTKSRYLTAATVAVALLAVGVLFVALRGGQQEGVASAMEEPCATDIGQGGPRVGYSKTILLCSVDSLRCKPDQTRVLALRNSGSWNTAAMMIPDIPDGYVITGGDMLNPSRIVLRNLGFDGIEVTPYSNPNDYCMQHYWYFVHADHTSPEPEDRARARICVYYDKWRGTSPLAPCPNPLEIPPE